METDPLFYRERRKTNSADPDTPLEKILTVGAAGVLGATLLGFTGLMLAAPFIGPEGLF